MSDKRPDLRFNNRELVGVFVLLIVVSSLIFGLGVFVGKGMSETKALLFLKEQYQGVKLAQRSATDPENQENYPQLERPATPEEGIRSPSDDSEEVDDNIDEFDIEPYESGDASQESRRSPRLNIPLGFKDGDVKEVLLDGEKKVPYKSEMAKIYKNDSQIFTIVLLNTSNRAKAETLVKSLGQEIEGVYMDAREAGSGLVYRVLMGKYRSKGKADSVASLLKNNQLIKKYSIQTLD